MGFVGAIWGTNSVFVQISGFWLIPLVKNRQISA
jgi:hypothetical protein